MRTEPDTPPRPQPWGRVLPSLLPLIAALCAAVPGSQSLAGEKVLFDFERGTAGWHASSPSGQVTPLRTALTPGRSRRRALRVDAAFPKETTIKVESKFDWTHYDELRFKVFVPSDGPLEAQAVVYVKDGELRWYQTLLDLPVERGAWSTVRVDISHRSLQWSFQGHYRPWDGYTKQEVAELGIKFMSRRTYVGPIYMGKVSLVPAPSDRGATRPHLFDFRTNSNTVPRYGKFEITFELARTYANPFDPREVDVRGRFVSPTGDIAVVPGFFYQNYVRMQERREERLQPMGRSKWKVRFAPTEVGTYRYFVQVNDGTRCETRMRSFQAVASDNPGYVRISKADPHYFELDNGDFFYPIGHNVCATFDVRNAENLEVAVVQHEGTFAYERYFARMAANGENLARIWLAAWAFSLEWSKDYDIHFQGLGRYNLENAWRLDYIMELAERYGIYVMFTFTPHGEMQPKDASHAESDWQYSPYSIANGGFLRSPQYFWTHPDARLYYERKCRYILSRWGYSPKVFAWEIFNEVDLANYYRSQRMGAVAAQWTGQTAQFLKDNDPAGHLVTTNLFYLNRTSWAAPLWSRPELDMTTGHLFSAQLPQYLRGMYIHMAEYNKIFFVTECGDTPFGQGPKQTEDYLHMGIWASHAMPYAGVAMPWWWIFIDDRGLYRHFKALAKFAEGEDRRGKDITFKASQITHITSNQPVSRYGVECAGNPKWAVVWAYDQNYYGLTADETKLSPDKMALVVADMATGPFQVEIWDPYKGEIMETRQVQCVGGHIVVTPLSIDRDVALKIKYRDTEP